MNVNLIYMGEKYPRETNMSVGAFLDPESGENWHWDDVQAALIHGIQVNIRPATAEEIATAEMAAALTRAKASASLHSSGELH